MDVHIPRPGHGWRALAREIGIIVLGVLIALAAEQGVSALHERTLAAQTRTAARAELRAALMLFINRRAIQPCIERRLDEVERLLEASDQPGYRPPAWIGRPQRWGFSSAGWDAAAQSGRVALLGQADQTEFGALYTRLHDLNELQLEEQRAWALMRQLENQARLEPQTRAGVRAAVQEARLTNWNIRVDLEQSFADGKTLGLVTEPTRLTASPSICLPTNTPRAQAVARVNAFFADKLGEP